MLVLVSFFCQPLILWRWPSQWTNQTAKCDKCGKVDCCGKVGKVGQRQKSLLPRKWSVSWPPWSGNCVPPSFARSQSNGATMQGKAIACCCPPVPLFTRPQSTGVIEQSFPTYCKPSPNELLRALSELGTCTHASCRWWDGGWGDHLFWKGKSPPQYVHMCKGYKTRGSPALTPLT